MSNSSSSSESLSSASEVLSAATRVLEEHGSRPLASAVFLHNLQEVMAGNAGLISEEVIEPVTDLPHYAEIEEYREKGLAALKKLVVVKLNGGLGTSMGLEQAKSLLPVRGGESFLHLILNQVTHLRQDTGVSLPLLLLNSFRTESDTEYYLSARRDFLSGQTGPTSLLQNQVPKLRQDTLLPVSWSKDPSLEWCPPGHGDLFVTLYESGALKNYLDQGLEYLFVSNSDNLAATIDPAILGYFAESAIEFLMEVAERQPADRKGGHLARKGDRLILRERSQTAPEDYDTFEDISRYGFFNTNSLWISLRSLYQKMEESEGNLRLPLIKNSKTVDPTDADSPAVFQIETAMGSAIQCFEDSQGLVVPRTRFAPVKTTDDLLFVWSDNYEDRGDGTIVLRDPETPPTLITLDKTHYRHVDQFVSRFPHGAPSLIECSSLEVFGDVVFEANVICVGEVIVRNSDRQQKVIPEGTVLEGEVTL